MTSYRNSEQQLPIMQGSPPAWVVPRADWDRPPWNRWSFQHVREVLPTAEVWRGNGHRGKLTRAEADLDALPFASEGVPTTLARHLDETYTDGFLVLKSGAVAFERYFNGMTERTLHLSQSMAKSVTAHGVRHTCRSRPGRCVAGSSPTICRNSPRPAGAAPRCSRYST